MLRRASGKPHSTGIETRSRTLVYSDKLKGHRMNNIQKAFKNKAKRGLRMAIGGLLSPGRGNDLTRSRQMGEAADEMERTRLAEEADAAARRTQPPVAAPVVTNVGGPAQNPLDSKLSMGEAMAGLSNTERYKLGGSGTAAEASELGQRNDIMRTMRTAMGAPMQDTNPFKNLAAGGATKTGRSPIHCSSSRWKCPPITAATLADLSSFSHRSRAPSGQPGCHWLR